MDLAGIFLKFRYADSALRTVDSANPPWVGVHHEKRSKRSKRAEIIHVRTSDVLNAWTRCFRI